MACWAGMKRTQSIRKSEILISRPLEWIVSLCAWIVVDFWALFISRYPDKWSQSGDAPQDSKCFDTMPCWGLPEHLGLLSWEKSRSGGGEA